MIMYSCDNDILRKIKNIYQKMYNVLLFFFSRALMIDMSMSVSSDTTPR